MPAIFAAHSATFWLRKTRWSRPRSIVRTVTILPVDPRLPGGGGNQLCGFYNVSPPPFQSQYQFLRAIPLPWGFQASGAFVSTPGPDESLSVYVATRAQVTPSLGRPILTASVKLPMMPEGALH